MQDADLRGGQARFAAAVDSSLFGQGDALTFALPEQRPLKLGERAHHRQQQLRHRRIVAGERQLFLEKLHPHAVPGQVVGQPA